MLLSCVECATKHMHAGIGFKGAKALKPFAGRPQVALQVGWCQATMVTAPHVTSLSAQASGNTSTHVFVA
jgi:hypothetical protein